MQAETKSSTSSQLILLTTLTIPRKTLANVCMASIQRSLRKQITWKIRFITASISSIILAKKSRMMSNNFSMVSHIQQATREKNSTNSCDAFDIRFFMFEIVPGILSRLHSFYQNRSISPSRFTSERISCSMYSSRIVQLSYVRFRIDSENNSSHVFCFSSCIFLIGRNLYDLL